MPRSSDPPRSPDARQLPPLKPGDREVDIPAPRIPDAHRRAVEAVRSAPTLKRPLVVRSVSAPVAVYRRLLDELPLAADVVRQLGAGSYRISIEGEDTFHIDDGHGASARVERILREPGVRVYLAHGVMSTPLLPVIRGLGVITLRFEPRDERTLTGGQIYFRLDANWLHRVVRALVPLLYTAIDRKVHRLTEAAIDACRHVAAREPE